MSCFVEFLFAFFFKRPGVGCIILDVYGITSCFSALDPPAYPHSQINRMISPSSTPSYCGATSAPPCLP